MATTFRYTDEAGVTRDVTLVSGDYIRVNLEIRKELGISPSELTVFEYQHRLVHRAGQRLGFIDTDFLTWSDTIAELDEAEDAEGEAEATPAS